MTSFGVVLMIIGFGLAASGGYRMILRRFVSESELLDRPAPIMWRIGIGVVAAGALVAALGMVVD